MDDIGKALIMGAQILMFIFASSISIYLYTTLTANINDIMLASDYSNRGDAIFGSSVSANEREATKPEVVLAILDLKDKHKKTGDSSYQVHVAGKVYSYYPSGDAIISSGAITKEIKFGSGDKLVEEFNTISDSLYTLSYDESSKVLIYTPNT